MTKDENQIDKELLHIEKWHQIQQKLVLHFASSYSGAIQSQEIFEALFLLLSEKHKLEWQGSMWDVDIEFEEALTLLSNFDFTIILNKIETEEGVIPKSLLIQFKVRIKSKGLIWVIHRYDEDPFPSNPHAHQLENNIKLDLSNGKCYILRDHIYTIKKKDLLLIREKAIAVFKGELPPLTV